MVYRLFTLLLSYKLTRWLLLCLKKHISVNWIINMLYEWYEKDFIIQCPQSNFIGENVTKKLIPLIKNYKFQKVLIVTDKSLIKFKIVDILSEELKTNAIEFNIFDGVTPNPTIATVNEILNAYYNNKNDAIISVGGGSSHDAAKAAVMLITNSKVRNLRKFQGLNVTRHVAIMPIICVNTTSGTGSECTNVAVITNETAHYKMTLVDKYLQPSITVNDSSMLKTLPPYITATTGMDALVHAIESHLSLFNNPYAQSQARMAINLIFKWLPIACNEGKNIRARDHMAYAEFMAGIAFNSTSLGFVHALSHSLSARFNTPHGLANAILLIYILDYELEVPIVQVKLKQIVNYIDLKPADFSAAECIKRIMTLLKTINIPLTLKDIHPELSAKDIKIMAKTAMKDFTGISNPIQFSNRQIKQIYRNAYAGKLIHSNITLTN